MDNLIDLRTVQKSGLNAELIRCLDKLIACTTDGMRRNSFAKGLKAIKAFDQEITSGAMAKAKIPGIGKGIADRIDEFLKTGGLAEIHAPVLSEEECILKELCTVTGIGEVRAKRLMTDYLVIGVADLIARYKAGEITIKPNALTQHITVGLDFYYDLLERFSRDEADKLLATLTKHLTKEWPDIKVIACGSYRRGLPTCGDLDILLCPSKSMQPETTLLTKVVDLLTRVELLAGNLTHEGTTKYMGVCRLPGGKGRRIDIRVIPVTALGAAQLYFTGSGEFNVAMRNEALKQGYTLNEYGLYRLKSDGKGDLIPCETEEEIFAHLKLVYLAPQERSI